MMRNSVTVPTRALANDKLAEWRARGWDVGISTGDVALNLDARVVVATLETQRGRLLRGEGPGLLVMDEFQMLGEDMRGVHYELAVALAPRHTQLLFLSGSVANPQDVVAWLQRIDRNAVHLKRNAGTQRHETTRMVLKGFVADKKIRVFGCTWMALMERCLLCANQANGRLQEWSDRIP